MNSKCMDCGIPFCHWACPVQNLIPEFNDLTYRNSWQAAYDRLSAANPFPEITSRICPAPCKKSCVLSISNQAVDIREIEQLIIDRAFEEGWVKPILPAKRSGKKVAVVGSGPAGLACAEQLNRKGHKVVVFEQSDRAGGILMYGIPNAKLDKQMVARRTKLLEEAGIEFLLKTKVGTDISAPKILDSFDVVVLCTGASEPRDLKVHGRESQGIIFAMDYLTEATKSLLDKRETKISAKNLNVIVIGGGETGTDCMTTALSQNCKSVRQFEIMNSPAEARAGTIYNIQTKRFIANTVGRICGVETFEQPATVRTWDADLVLLSLGFTGADKKLIDAFEPGNPKVFVAGDARRGPGLVAWAIQEGKQAASMICGGILREQFK